jgi:hypothetical protein
VTTELDGSTPIAAAAPPDAAVRAPWVRGAIAGGAVACGCAAIALVNPSDTGVPVCWSAGLFGVDCPLCGGLRCVNALARGDWLAAADHNVLLAVALPIVVVVWAVWMFGALRGRSVRLPSVPVWAWTVLGVVTLGFTVVRNMDLGPVAHYLAASSG